MTDEGIFSKWAAVSNGPITGTHLWLVAVLRYSQTEAYGLTQLAFAASEQRAFFRGLGTDGTTWTSWKEFSLTSV